MGQAPIKDNIFRDGIILGFCLDGVNITKAKPYPNGLNYGLIIKPLYLEMKFRLPVMMYFNGLPYHVGIITSDITSGVHRVFSFCPDLREPHRGTLYKDIKIENPASWFKESELCEIFWLVNKEPQTESIETCLCKAKQSLDECGGTEGDMGAGVPDAYDKITARLIDLLNIKNIGLDEYNRRHQVNISMSYNLLSNNCTNVALAVLIGKSTCYQIDYIKPIILAVLKCEAIVNQLPEYSKKWISDFYNPDST